MKDDIVLLAKKLIAIKSDSDNKEELERALNVALSQLEGFTIERFEKNGFKSALVYTAKVRPAKFKVILNGHLDVIPGKDFQYTPKIVGDRLYGVGAMDMKSSVACLIYAFKDVAEKVTYPLALQLVTEEETGGFYGTKYQIEEGVKADFVIAGESTALNIANRAKGILLLKISTKGKTAHGAYPWKGENAILKMMDFLETLENQFPNPKEQLWVTTFNVSRIETPNKAFNKIPDECTVWIDIRFVPEADGNIFETLKELLPDGFSYEEIENEPALFTPEDNNFLEILKQKIEMNTKKEIKVYGAQGTSDARHYTRFGISGVEFGPEGANIGSDDEYVSIESLVAFYQILKDFLLELQEK